MNKTISYLTFLIGFISFFPSFTALYQQRWKVKQHTALLSSVRDEFSGKKNTKIYRIDIPLGDDYFSFSECRQSNYLTVCTLKLQVRGIRL